MWGLVYGNYRVEIYIHLLDLTRNSWENATAGPGQESNLRPCDPSTVTESSEMPTESRYFYRRFHVY